MRMERAQRWRRLFSIGIVGVILFTTSAFLFSSQARPAYAADLSGSYSWKPLKIGGGGFVTGLAIHPTAAGVVYARTDVGGAYRWNESTQTWTQLIVTPAVPNPAAGDYNVESIAVSKTNSQVVYVAVGDDIGNATGRILKSTNRGASWTDSGQRWSMAGNGDYRTGSARIAVDPNNDNVVYFASRKEGLWVSTDAASHWSQVSTSQIPLGTNSSGTTEGVSFVRFDPSGGVSGGKTNRIYAGVAGNGVYRSDNGGSSWYRILTTDQIPYSVDIASDGTLYLSILSTTGAGSLQKYAPGSGTWSTISPSGDSYMQVAVDPFNAQRVIVAGGGVSNGHIWRTTNAGASWTALNIAVSSPDIPWITNTDESNYMTSAQIVFDPLVQDRLWFPQGTGVWRSDNNTGSTITWTFISKGIEEMVANDVIAPPGGKPITGVWDRNGYYHANPDAYPTRPILTNQFSSGWSLDYSGGTPSFVAAVSSDHRFLNPDMSGYSTDGGQTWTQFSGSRNYSDLFGGNIAVSATNTSNIVWLPTWGKAPYVTTDRGATWTQIPFFSTVGGLHQQLWWGSKKALDADKVSGGTYYIYSTDNNGEFFRSSNNGQTWEQAPGIAPPSGGNDAHVFGQIRAVPGKAGHVWASVAQGGLYYTTNKGDAWTKVAGVQEARSFGFGKAIGSYPVVFINGKVNNQWGIWRSVDQGATWDLLSANPMGIYDQVHTVNGDMSIAGRVYVGFSGNSFVYGDANGSTPTPTPTPTPAGATITRATTAPTIDGNSTDAVWSTAPSYPIAHTVGAPTGFSSSYQSAWDSNNLYFLVKVNDATLSSHADAVELYLDPQHNGGSSYDSTDTQYIFSTDSNTILQYQGGTQGTNTAGVTFSNKTTSSGYQVEIQIPWARLGLTPSANATIGLDLDTWQNWQGGAGVKNKLFWNATSDDDWFNPGLFGSGTLQGTGGNATLTPSADRDNWAQNAGDSTTLNASQWQTIYLKFDLSTVSSVSKATLRLYRTDLNQGSTILTASQVTDDSWTEASTTLPAVGASISTATSATVGYVDLDVTSFVQAQKAADGIVSIGVSSNSTSWVGFYSRDNATNKPQLVVTG
ncbi:hypothetical protein KDA_06290 [Dictyobacter alpinus]|uniref:Uncharacterized protein n=1 Tax=Dictyobacter alpinus TaxID=2014873 RepID=A0A402B1A7_9CHLR|nr:sugar-binding protein [Dictyobacter alpinus]GCE25145.1 hypothetical protein KDA_06290 [Dictyobacter alpinus]